MLTLQLILDVHHNDVETFKQNGELSKPLFEALFDYYLNSGEMPYGIAKAHTGDPYQWIGDRFEQELV